MMCRYRRRDTEGEKKRGYNYSFAIMPTLVWVRRRPKSGTGAAGEGSDISRRDEAAVLDPVGSAAAVPDSVGSAVSAIPDPAHVALPAVAGGRKGKKRKNQAKEVKSAKKKSKRATLERDLPTGVYKVQGYKTASGKFRARIRWCDKRHNIGAFDTPEQGSAAYLSVSEDLSKISLSGLGADEADAIFDAARKKAVEAVGGSVPQKKDLPRGVSKLPSGTFGCWISWGGKVRYIGTFVTPKQASAVYMSVRKDLDNGATFNAARKKAVEDARIKAIEEMKRKDSDAFETKNKTCNCKKYCDCASTRAPCVAQAASARSVRITRDHRS